MEKSRAIFLDRDGVIIHNRANYIISKENIKIYPFAIPALRILKQLDFSLFIISNQSAVGRGIINIDQMESIQNSLEKSLWEQGITINGTYFCPHHPEANCECRKPRPGLIFSAVEKHRIDLSQSWMIGDAYSDIEAAKNAGIQNTFLVRTGRGNKQIRQYQYSGKVQPAYITKNILSAANTLQHLYKNI